MYYSPSTGGFYSVEVHSDAIPNDAMEISDMAYQELMNGQCLGQMIVAGPNGRPSLQELVLSADQVRAANRRRQSALLAQATSAISPLQDAIDIGVATEAEHAMLLAWKRYRVAINRIDQQPGYPSKVVWPERPDQAA
jgi:hypothetical protein